MSANPPVSVSLFDSLLPKPQSNEGKNIRINTVKKKNDSELDKLNKEHMQKCKIARLFLQIAKQTTVAIKTHCYTEFDALIKNSGCQITALEVYRLVQIPDLEVEAKRIRTIVDKNIRTLKEEISYSGATCKLGLGNKKNEIGEALEQLGIDVEIDPVVARLVRLRLLCIVNSNEIEKYSINVNGETLKKEGEVTITKEAKLLKLVRKIDIQFLHLLVNGIQAEESVLAADFISKVANELNPQVIDRAPLLKEALSDKNRRSSEETNKVHSSTVSFPLLYNTEAAIRGLKTGVILIKNKLKIANKKIDHAEPFRILIDAETHRILNEEKRKDIAPEGPLVVIEGYVKNGDRLKELIQDKGLIHIVNANSAKINQYASKTSQDKIDNEEIQSDLERYKVDGDIPSTVFEIDHFYCSTLEKEQ